MAQRTRSARRPGRRSRSAGSRGPGSPRAPPRLVLPLPRRPRDRASNLGHLLPELLELGQVLAALVDERAQLLQRLLELRLVLEALEPHLRVHPVVRLLAVDLRGEAGDLRVVRLDQLLDPPLVRVLVETMARDRLGPVRHEAQLDELRAAVLLRLAVERELVRGRPELLRDQLVER